MPTTNKDLRSWKNFVLNFRKDFDAEFELNAETHSARVDSQGSPDQFTSLSMLLYALASAQSMDEGSLILKTNAPHSKSNPQRSAPSQPSGKRKVRNATVDLSDAIKRSRLLSNSLQRAQPPALPFLLIDRAGDYPKQLSKILKAIEISSITHDPFIIGYTYQYWRDCDRKDAQSGIQSADKQIDKDRLVAFTQIYTPEWVVEFILANTILPLLEPHLIKRSRLFHWLTPNHHRSQTEESPAAISLIDPAAGAGNFLVGAFDALFELHTIEGNSPEQAAQLIAKQLHGCDIDPVALSVAALALVTRCRQHGVDSPPLLQGLALATPSRDELLGSLSNDFPDSHPLCKKHHVVITNPPYIGRKLISRQLKSLLKSRFPDSHHDLSAAFFEKSLSLLNPGGRVGLITQASMLFLPSHEKLRKLILDSYKLKAAIDAGPGVFPLQSGEKVNSAIVIVEKPEATRSSDTKGGADEDNASFFNLKDSDQKPELLLKLLGAQSRNDDESMNGSVTVLNPESFRRFQKLAFNYDIPPAVTQLLEKAPPLECIADIRQGLATTDNERFVKLIWQVQPDEIGQVWFPYVKGAGGQRYSSPIRHVVNWQDNGAAIKAAVSERYPYLNGKTAWVVKNESFYFKEGLCFSFVNTRGIAVRKLPQDCIFDVGASAIFSQSNDFLLAYLNSSFMVALANSLNPTINNQVGDLKRFPVVHFDESTKQRLSQLACQCSNIKQQINALIDPSSWYSNLVLVKSQRNCRPISHPFFDTIDNLGYEEAFKQYDVLLLDLYSSLDSRETEIDAIVLKSVAQVENWSVPTIEKVDKWIQSCNTRTANTLPPDRMEIFANNLLIHEILNPVANRVPGQSAGLALIGQPAMEQPATHRPKTKTGAFSSESFQSHLEKYFLGFPPEPLRSFDLKGIVS